jgi:hypothetical protein
MRIHSALGIGSLALVFAGCAAPEVRHVGPHVEEEDGITRLQYEEPELAPFVVEGSDLEKSFDLVRMRPQTSFDRIGVRWDAHTNGGMTQVQVRVLGTSDWLAVVVDDEQTTGDGRTFYAGHVDVPAGAELESRVRVVKGAGAALSPRFTSLAIEVFDRGVISEYGEVQGGDGAGAGSDEATAQPDVMPGELAPEGATLMAVEEPTIVSRESWAARAPRCNGATHSPYRMTFHHTETPNGERGAAAKARMRQMQAYHQNSRGWCDIGYHFVVDADGVVYRGRTTTSRSAAHVANQNTGNLGVALMGSYVSTAPPQAALDGMAATFAFLANTWNIPVTTETLRGHKQWNGQSTSCPGSPLIGLKQEILDGVKMILDDAGPEPTPAPDSTPPPTTSGEVIVDDSSPLFYASPNWFASSSIPTPYGAGYHARSSETTSDPAVWAAALDGGDYEVLVRWTAANNRAQSAPYFVYHQYGSTTVFADQTANGSQWMTLGTYTFPVGTTDRVGLSCWTASGDFVIADAVRFVPR